MRIRATLTTLALAAALNSTAAMPIDKPIEMRFPAAGGKVHLSHWKVFPGEGDQPTHGLGVTFTEQAWHRGTERVIVTVRVRLANGQTLQLSGTGRATQYPYDFLLIPAPAAIVDVEAVFVEELSRVTQYKVQ